MVTDAEGNIVDTIGSSPDKGQVILPGTPPSKPSAPIVSATLGTAQVSWDGLFVEEYVAPDLKLLEVHGSTEIEEFETTSGTLLGTITNLSGGSMTAGLEYGSYFIKLIAVTTSDAKSVPSDASSVEIVPLVEAPDMVEVLADIDERYNGIITDAGNLSARLDEAAQDLVDHETRLAEAEADLTNLNDVELVQLKSSLDQAKLDLAQAQADVDNALAGLDLTNTDLDTLKNTTLPALENTVADAKNRLDTAEGEIATSKTRLAEAEADLTAVTADTGKALTMAGSKTTVFYNTSAPTTAVHPNPTNAKDGDLWRRIDASKNVLSEWYWTGSAWQASKITTSAISNLDVGQLTSGSAIIQTAVINKIAAQTATIIELNGDRITAGTVSSDRINVTDLAAKIATVIQLNADRITAGTIATGRLNATEVAAAVANVIQLNASRITAGTISTARLNASEIAAAVATIINLNADRITAGVINTDRLNVNEIAARTASFQTVDVKNLFVTTGTMSEAVINKLWVDVVLSKKITAEMIAVGDFTNYATINPSMNLNVSIPAKWSTTTDGDYTRTAPTSENYLMFKNMDGPIPFQGGDKLRISFDAVADSANVTFSGRIWFYNSSGTYITGFNSTFTDTTITSTEKRFTGFLDIPSIPTGSSQYLIGISGNDIKTVKLRNVRVLRMTAGELIVDGAITATKIAANAIEADKLAANSVTSDKILAGSIKAQHIEAKAISTDKLAIGSLDNVLPDPDNLLNSWTDPSASSPAVARWQFTSTEARPERSKNYQQINLGSGGNTQGTVYFGYNKEMISVEPGQSFTGYAWMRNNKTTNDEYNYASLRFYFYDKAGALISGSGGNQNGGQSTTLSGVWTRVGGLPVTAPAGAVGMRIRPTVYFSNHVANGEIFFCGAMSVFRASSGELIVDGAIDGKTITGALIQTDRAVNVGVKLSNAGIEAYSPQGEKTFSITAGQGVDYIGVWGNDLATIDEAGNIIYPSGAEPEQMVSLDYLGSISGSELSVSDYARFDGNVVMNGDPIADSHLGIEAPGEFGPVINGRSLLGGTFNNFVDQHPQVSDITSWLTPLSHGFKANAYVNDDTSRSTGKAGGLSADGRWVWSGEGGGLVDRMMIQQQVEIVNNRGYFLTYSVPAVRSTDGKSGTVGASVVRYSTGSLNVNTGTPLNDTRIYIPGDGVYFNPTKAVYFVGGQDVPAGTITFGIQVYVYDNRTMETTDTPDARFWNISITDMGLATKGTTGKAVDLYRRLPKDTTPETTSPPPPAPAPDLVQYTKTWSASWYGTYDSSGTNTYYDSRGRVTQGRPPGAGIQRGLVGFPSVTSTLSGATVKKVEVYLYAAHAYYNSGFTAVLGTHGLTSKPSSYASGDIDVKRQAFKKPEGRWVTLPSSVHAGFKSGSLRGIQAYINTTSLSYYGYFTGSKSKLRITYVK